MSTPKFSVVLAVYEGESSEHFKLSLKSLHDQTVQPDEVVIVKDGPLSSTLEEEIQSFIDYFPNTVEVIELPENRGAGKAYQVGIEATSHDIVAQQNADDVSVEDRFEVQLDYLRENETVDVVGGYVQEYTDKYRQEKGIRKVPCDAVSVIRFAKFRSPVNNPTAMFRRDSVLAAGNYRDIRRGQDYELWGRMITEGFVIENIPKVLVKMHADEEFYRRKGGLSKVKNVLFLEWELYKMGLFSLPHLILNLVIKIPVKLFPTRLRKLIYQSKLRDHTS